VKRTDVSFDETVARFQGFLGKNQYSENILWLTPEDVLLSGRRFVYVRVPIPAANEINARKIYDEGVANGRGLLMSTICEMNGSTCCYVWYPRRQEEEPQGLWPHDGSVKLSATAETSKVPAKPVKSRLFWAFLKLRTQGKQNLKESLFR
jgi:hypothetical protein